MAAQTVHPHHTLLPMPELNAEALRAAVATLVPSRLPELFDHLASASTTATQTNSLAPLRAFAIHWGMIVAIERQTERAARLHECERIVEESDDPDERRAAISEIGRILRAAREEVDA